MNAGTDMRSADRMKADDKRTVDRMQDEAGFGNNPCDEPLENLSLSSPAPGAASGVVEIEAAKRLFDEEWGLFAQAYPLNGAMSLSDAKREFRRLVAGDRARAIEGAGKYRLAVAASGTNFPRHAATWLRNREFDYELPTVPIAGGPAVSPLPSVFIAKGSAEFDAWVTDYKLTRGTPPPVFDRLVGGLSGFMRHSRWPPEHGGAPRTSAAPSPTLALATVSSEGR
jgi:hypothetical protein